MSDYKRRMHEHEEFVRQAKIRGIIGAVAFILLSGLLFLLFKIISNAYIYYHDKSKLDYTVSEISLLVDNIRQIYALEKGEMAADTAYLINRGIIPAGQVRDGQAVNMFGGNIIIAPANPLVDKKAHYEAPTFKISYQGLPQRICVKLAMLDWGNPDKGLVAVALGYVNKLAQDKAFIEIDLPPEQPQQKQYLDKKGRLRSLNIIPQPRLNIARPHDSFMPTPFVEDIALMGCNCGEEDNCSFALQYKMQDVKK